MGFKDPKKKAAYQLARQRANRDKLHKYTRSYRRKNRAKVRAKGQRYYAAHKSEKSVATRAYKYRLTKTQVRDLLTRINCDICKAVFANDRAKHIDHNHTTGVVRGVLCVRCNSALGLVHDDVGLLNLLAGYLQRFGSKE